MEGDIITITSPVREQLEYLKRCWRLSTDQQVLERVLGAGKLAEPSQEEPGQPPHSERSRSREQALRRLRRATKPLRGKSLQELKQEIHEEALRQAGA